MGRHMVEEVSRSHEPLLHPPLHMSLGHPYRSALERPSGRRWGVTPWVKRYMRIAQWFSPVALHYKAERLKRRFAREEERFRENAIAHCWEGICRDAGFLYPPHCECGEHECQIFFASEEAQKKYEAGEPYDAKMRWQRRSA